MYYHSRELKHVRYDKVEGFVEAGDWFIPAYQWLSQYCGFYPHLWLSRSSSMLTGYRFRENGILFGFDYIKGFFVDYQQWERALTGLTNVPEHTRIRDIEKIMRDYFMKSNFDDDKEDLDGEERIFPVRDYEYWRDNHLFVEHDQVVVPRLNLKVAKKIICRNEREKKALRKIGFINDRITVMNFKKS